MLVRLRLDGATAATHSLFASVIEFLQGVFYLSIGTGTEEWPLLLRALPLMKLIINKKGGEGYQWSPTVRKSHPYLLSRDDEVISEHFRQLDS